MIHVFNSTSSALDMSVNRGPVQAPDRTTPENGYQPFSKLCELRKFPAPGVFCPGDNTVNVRFRDFKPPLPPSACFAIHVPEGASIQSDFVLFLFANSAALMRPSGEIVENVSYAIRRATGGENSASIATQPSQKE